MSGRTRDGDLKRGQRSFDREYLPPPKKKKKIHFSNLQSVGTSLQPSGGNRNQPSIMASMDPSSSSSGDEPMTQNKWPPRLETPKQQRKGTSIQRSGLGKGHSKLQPGLCGDWWVGFWPPLPVLFLLRVFFLSGLASIGCVGLGNKSELISPYRKSRVRPFSSQLMLLALAGQGCVDP